MLGRIALFIHQPKCSVQSGNGIMRALSPHYEFKLFTQHEIEDDFFDDVDLVCVPGGVGDADSYPALMFNHQKSIRQFVSRGGGYLGICMGAYWAGSHYLDILDGVDAVQYITRPTACTRRPHPKSMPVTWQGQQEKMYFYDGCALVGNPVKFKTIATYPNGDPMAIMQGRVGLIGCHPEAVQNWYQYPSWMPKQWSGNCHHMLFDFVNTLLVKEQLVN